MAQLDDEGKRFLTEYADHMEQRIEDGDVDSAKLAGEWPGWEFMTALKDLNLETHEPVLVLKPITPQDR